MNIIHDYVDTMFKDLPKTEEVIRMKLEILDNMEEAYHELLKEGKTENEAIGAVISQFGNINELKEELGIPQDEKEETASIPFKEEEEIMDYLHFKINFGHMMGLGTALCIVAFIPTAFDLAGDIDMILFLLIAVMGVVLFIIGGIKNNDYRELETQQFQVRPAVKENLQRQYEQSKTMFSTKIAIGVVLCIFGVISYMIIENAFNWAIRATSSHFLHGFSEGLATGSLFICAAVGIYLFITAGIKKAAYDTILHNRQKVIQKKQEEEEDKLYAIVMPTAAMLYLIMGFCFGWWHPGWIIFPLAVIFVSGYSYLKRDTFS